MDMKVHVDMVTDMEEWSPRFRCYWMNRSKDTAILLIICEVVLIKYMKFISHKYCDGTDTIIMEAMKSITQLDHVRVHYKDGRLPVQNAKVVKGTAHPYKMSGNMKNEALMGSKPDYHFHL